MPGHGAHSARSSVTIWTVRSEDHTATAIAGPVTVRSLDELGALTRKQATGTFDGSEVSMAERFIVVCSPVDLWRETAMRRDGLSW